MMRIGGKRAALPGLEVHHVVAERAACAALSAACVGFLQQREMMPKLGIGGFWVPAMDWKTRSTGAPRSMACRCVFVTWVSTQLWVGISKRSRKRVEQHAAAAWRRDAVGRRVDADDGIAAAVEQPVEDGGGDAAGVVGRVIRLQADRHAAGQADGVAKTRDDAAALRGEDEVLVAHQL